MVGTHLTPSGRKRRLIPKMERGDRHEPANVEGRRAERVLTEKHGAGKGCAKKVEGTLARETVGVGENACLLIMGTQLDEEDIRTLSWKGRTARDERSCEKRRGEIGKIQSTRKTSAICGERVTRTLFKKGPADAV